MPRPQRVKAGCASDAARRNGEGARLNSLLITSLTRRGCAALLSYTTLKPRPPVGSQLPAEIPSTGTGKRHPSDVPLFSPHHRARAQRHRRSLQGPSPQQAHFQGQAFCSVFPSTGLTHCIKQLPALRVSWASLQTALSACGRPGSAGGARHTFLKHSAINPQERPFIPFS